MNDDSGSMVKRANDEGGCGVVHDQRYAKLPADCGDLSNGKHMKLWVRQCLGIVSPRAFVCRLSEAIGIGRIDEADFDTQLLQCL